MQSRANTNSPAAPKQPFAAMDLSSLPRGSRDRGRLKLLKLTFPIAAFLGLLGLWMIGQSLWTSAAKTQFLEGKESKAEVSFARQMVVTQRFPEPWLAQYNLGTTLLANGDLDRGTALLEQAFDGVPKAESRDDGGIEPFAYECSVRINLSAGIEMQGDKFDAEGATDQAVELYQEALDWVSPCELQSPSSGSDSAGQGQDGEEEDQQNSSGESRSTQGNQAGDRLREKLRQSGSGSSGVDGDEQDNSGEQQGQNESEESPPFEGETPEKKKRREELEEQNRRHDEQLREQEESSGWGSGGGW